MPTILLLDDNTADQALICHVVRDGEHTLFAAQNVEAFRQQMVQQPIDLAIISLAAVSEKDIQDVQKILRDAPATKVLALAPSQSGDGLATLLKAESLHARRLLAKPIDPQQLLTILNLTFPLPTQQD